jgi:CubicO group peptidase (beta-lactamase class C family)
MTATLIGILVHRGETSWTRTIGEVFPAWSEGMDSEFREVTFEQLVAHRSGLLLTSEYENSALWGGGTLPQQRKEHTRRIVHRSSLGVSGVTYKYHNSNYIIAGSMLEEITGKSWEALMADELFDPLGMASAGFMPPSTGNQVDQPWGHSDSTGSRVASPDGDNVAGCGPAGTVHASMRDWAKFIRLHLTGSEGGVILSAATLARLQTEHTSNPLWPQRYGWGWINFDEFGGPGLAHDGSNGLWYVSVVLYPDLAFAVMAVTNIGSDVNGNGQAAVGDVISLLKNRHLQDIPDPVPSPCDDRQIRMSGGDITIQTGLTDREMSVLDLFIDFTEPGPENSCFGDFDNDGDVDGPDLSKAAFDYGRTDCLDN